MPNACIISAMYHLKTAAETAGSLRPADSSSRDQVAELILDLPLFQDLDWKDANILSRYFKLCTVAQGDILFREGDRGDFMALIVDGAAEISKMHSPQTSVKVSAEGAGRIIGEMALVDCEPRSATVQFTKPGRILLISSQDFNELRAAHPKLGAAILTRLCRLLSQRLRRTTGQLSERLAP